MILTVNFVIPKAKGVGSDGLAGSIPSELGLLSRLGKADSVLYKTVSLSSLECLILTDVRLPTLPPILQNG